MSTGLRLQLYAIQTDHHTAEDSFPSPSDQVAKQRSLQKRPDRFFREQPTYSHSAAGSSDELFSELVTHGRVSQARRFLSSAWVTGEMRAFHDAVQRQHNFWPTISACKAQPEPILSHLSFTMTLNFSWTYRSVTFSLQTFGLITRAGANYPPLLPNVPATGEGAHGVEGPDHGVGRQPSPSPPATGIERELTGVKGPHTPRNS